jgi:hypothetical protein
MSTPLPSSKSERTSTLAGAQARVLAPPVPPVPVLPPAAPPAPPPLPPAPEQVTAQVPFEHIIWPAGHWHMLFEQTWVAAQA